METYEETIALGYYDLGRIAETIQEMTMRRIFIVAVAVALAPMAGSIAKPDEPTILSVDSATVTVLKEKPRILKLEATGKVATGGWTDGRLLRVIPLFPPADGIYDVKIVAVKPTGDVAQAVTPITINPLTWRSYPTDVKAVRFQAESNCMIAVLPGIDKATIDMGTCAGK